MRRAVGQQRCDVGVVRSSEQPLYLSVNHRCLPSSPLLMDVFRHQMYRLSVMEKVVGVVGRRSDGSDLVFTALVCRSSGGAAACVPPNRQLIGVVEKPLDLAA